MRVSKYVSFHGEIKCAEVSRYRARLYSSWDFVMLQN